MRVAVVLGTRPEIIKLAGVIDGLGDAVSVIHTGQHYDEGLSRVFLDGLGVPPPERVLDLGGLTRAAQIGRGTEQIAAALEELKPDAVVVQGDTNSALAGGLAANATGFPLVHVEAGLRSFDRAMPEEHNRVLVDHLSDLLAAPTDVAVTNLEREGIAGPHVIRTGNTVVEAVRRQLPDAAARAALLARYRVHTSGFVLATIHRPENTDDPLRLAEVLRQLAALDLPVVFPAHPRTVAAAAAAGLDGLLAPLRLVAPLDGPTFLGLAAEAAVLVSDSGGVQEEVTVLGRPVVVVRRSTERPEAFEHHAVLVGPDGIAAAAAPFLADPSAVHQRLAALPSPYGDGTASERIVAAIRSRYETVP